MRYQDSIKFDPDTNRVTVDFFNMTGLESMLVFLISKQVELVSDKGSKVGSQRQHVLSVDWSRCKTPACLCVKEELCVLGKLVFWDSRNVILEVLEGNVLRLAHERHQGIVMMRACQRTKAGGLRVCKSCHGC